MARRANTTHRLRPHGLSAQQLVDDYRRAHPGRLERQAATRVAPVPLVVEPATVGIPRILVPTMVPVAAVTA